MSLVCQKNKCNGCMSCIDICPMNCILIRDAVFAYNAEKNMDICIKCGKCEQACPNNTVIMKEKPVEWKQGWAEGEIRERSSSGGAAAAICRRFIQQGGYVASCLFISGKFLFEITNDMETVKRFSGSKYVKSNPSGIYEKIRQRLKTDKVLFIALPCQVAALKNIIKDQKNLYTIDLICHGTPSPKLLDKFLQEKRLVPDRLGDIQFRGEGSFGVIVDGKKVTPEGMDDYLKTFLNSVDYTENCYSCQFASDDRVADATLGDSWGTEYKEEEKKGVSLILIQTEKGRELVASSGLELRDVDIEVAKKENQQLNHPAEIGKNREKFLKMISSGKSFAYSTFVLYKKEIIKRNVKKILMVLGLR